MEYCAVGLIDAFFYYYSFLLLLSYFAVVGECGVCVSLFVKEGFALRNGFPAVITKCVIYLLLTDLSLSTSF